MQVIDEVTGKLESKRRCKKFVTKILKDNTVIYGYTRQMEHTIVVQSRGLGCSVTAIWDTIKEDVFYSNYQGCYKLKSEYSETSILKETLIFGQGGFPYTFSRRYEAVESFDIFSGKQSVIKEKSYPISKVLKYTIGLEFETAAGYIPENLCFRDGLIPLRDGSISGLEYSTVVLKGDRGLSLLEQQLSTLKKYTEFNKECSLHIHFGNFPLDPMKVWNLYQICLGLQNQIRSLVPAYTFKSSEYKANRKDYCNLLPAYRNFDELYQSLVGRRFLGSFEQPHPNDIRREAKWRIPTRYYWVNFINLLCYRVNKTVEFRLLRPSYNFKKIQVWLYILNAILLYAEGCKSVSPSRVNLQNIIETVYPRELVDKLKTELCKLEILTQNQSRCADLIGGDLILENKLFPSNEVI